MQILKRHQPPVAYKFIYLAAIIFGLLVILQASATNVDGEMEIRLQYIVLFLLNYIIWAVLIDWVYGTAKALDTFPKIAPVSIIAFLINFLLILVLHVIISNFFYYIFLFSTSDLTIERGISIFNDVAVRVFLSRALDLIVIIAILKIIDTYKILQNRKLQVIELENQLHISQLRSLKAQLNPHFLFNALHALHTLIGYQDEKAKAMVIKIGNLLRKMLDQRDRHTATLKEELDYLKDYLEIEQERFHDRLSVHFDIEKDAENLMVPALMLQPLAENAFKHGISLLEGRGTISLSAKIKENKLIITMSNTIPAAHRSPAINSTQLGLTNLKKRLRQLYGEAQSLETTKNSTVFTVTIAIKQHTA